MYLCTLFSLLGSVNSKDPVELHPKPQNIISGAVMKKVLFLLVDGLERTIAVYAMKERRDSWSNETINNQMNGISLAGLGLTKDCKCQRIWAGDTESGTYILHVLYQKGRDKILASYNVDEEFLEYCEG